MIQSFRFFLFSLFSFLFEFLVLSSFSSTLSFRFGLFSYFHVMYFGGIVLSCVVVGIRYSVYSIFTFAIWYNVNTCNIQKSGENKIREEAEDEGRPLYALITNNGNFIFRCQLFSFGSFISQIKRHKDNFVDVPMCIYVVRWSVYVCVNVDKYVPHIMNKFEAKFRLSFHSRLCYLLFGMELLTSIEDDMT